MSIIIITVIQRLNFIMPAIANSDPQILHHNLLARLFKVEFTAIRDIILAAIDITCSYVQGVSMICIR